VCSRHPRKLFSGHASGKLRHFTGAISENAANPRLGGTIRIPRLKWVLRGFWGSYYQAPPLSTVTGPLPMEPLTSNMRHRRRGSTLKSERSSPFLIAISQTVTALTKT